MTPTTVTPNKGWVGAANEANKDCSESAKRDQLTDAHLRLCGNSGETGPCFAKSVQYSNSLQGIAARVPQIYHQGTRVLHTDSSSFNPLTSFTSSFTPPTSFISSFFSLPYLLFDSK